MRDATLPFIGMYARPVNLLFESQDNITTSVLVESTSTTTLVPYSEAEDAAAYLESHIGTYNAAVLSQKTRYEGLTPYSSNVIVLGSDGLLAETAISDARYNNNEYMVNLINDLTGQEGGINISAVSFTSETFNASNAAAITTLIVFMIVIPLAALGGGFTFWLMRRRK